MQTAQRALSSAALVLGTSSLAASEDVGANPLGAVYSLMGEVTAKITKDAEEADKAYHEYFEWCDETSANAANTIKTAEQEKVELVAKVAELASDIQQADTKIEELAASTSEAEAELKDAAAIRGKEAADFAANERELTETVDALGRAAGILSKEMAKNPASFAQLDTSSTANTLQALSAVLDAASFNSHDQTRLLALVQAHQSDDDEEPGAPAVAAYKSKSGSIVDVIEDMKEKAEDQLSELRKTEVQTKHNFEMLKSSLEAQLADDSKHLDEEKAAKATAEEDKATAEKDLEATVKELEATKEQLATARSSCMKVAADHEASVASRKEELSVIAKAKKVLEESTSGAESKTYSLLQMSSARAGLVGREVVAAVKRLAKKERSPALAQLASRILAIVRHRGGADIFGKVKGLIQDMIQKLEKEADADAEEKAYCDEQMAKTEAKKSDLEDDISKMTARIDAAVAKSATLKEEIQVLEGELAALAKEQAELDNIRGDEHSDYVADKADLEQGLTGVRKALEVLQEYYGSSASMLQEDQPAKPQAFEKKAGAGGSIIDILETVESDIATNLAKVESEEADSKAEYDAVTQETAVTKASKEGDLKYKTKESAALDKTAAEYKADREGANAELQAVNEYYDKVKDRCIAKPETYEDRKARRAAEIQGLKDALTILDEETAFVQRRHHGRSSHATLSAQ